MIFSSVFLGGNLRFFARGEVLVVPHDARLHALGHARKAVSAPSAIAVVERLTASRVDVIVVKGFVPAAAGRVAPCGWKATELSNDNEAAALHRRRSLQNLNVIWLPPLTRGDAGSPFEAPGETAWLLSWL